MGNSLLDIKPHQVSRDLRGYSIFFYGAPKTGKTTIASQFPGALLFAFEKGYNAIPGVMAKPLNSWGEFKKTLSELKDPQVKEAFQTVIIDTVDIAYQYCEKYVCNRESTATQTYEAIGDIPYGKGYKLAQTEFDTAIRQILQMDYGLVLISHEIDKVMKTETGEEISKIIPTVDSRAKLVCERTCDIIGYARLIDDVETGKSETLLFLRGTPRFEAGSRFKYTPDFIHFTYDNLVNAIAEAIDKEAQSRGKEFITEQSYNKEELYADEKEYDFPELMKTFQDLVGDLMTKDQSVAPKITKIVESHLGKGKKVSDCTSDQAAQLDLIIFDLKKL